MKEDWAAPLPEDLAAWHFLSRTTFGPRPADLERVKQLGVKAFLDEQLHPEKINDAEVEQKIASLPTLTMSPAELMEEFPPRKQPPQNNPKQPSGEETGAKPPGGPDASMQRGPEMRPEMNEDKPRHILMELAREQFWRAALSQRQLQEVMVHFWMNHFNIYAAKGVDKYLLTSFEQEAIRPNALGRFDELLAATAQSPAMLFYLDNWLSVAPDAPSGNFPQRRRPNPFAFGPGTASEARRQAPTAQRRGLNENYARELMELHTLGVDGGYTQHDVREVARCFTGWTIDRPQQGGGFIFRPRWHDYGEKVVLGRKIKAGHGVEDGMEVLSLLAAHPSTAQFISRKLCRHFIADEPPASVVNRAAHTFSKTQGDTRAVLKSILTSPEFSSQAAFRAKVKSPFELAASALRITMGETDGGAPLMGSIQRMGQPLFLYQAPTGFPDRASGWINSGTLLARMNFAMALPANRIRGTQLDLQSLADSGDPQTALEQMVQRTLGGSVCPETRAAIQKSLEELSGLANSQAAQRTTVMAALLLGSPDFQRR